MGTITGNVGSAGAATYFNATRSLGCSCPAGFWPKQITFNGIGAGAYWKNNSGSKKILDIHLVNSAGTLLVANLMRITLNGNGTDSSTKTTKEFDASGYIGQGIYVLGGNATGNIYMQNASSITVTTVAVNYTLTVKAGTGGTCSSTHSGSVACGTQVTLTPSASTGYSFSSYSTNPSTTISSNKFTMPASNLTVTANFTHVVRTLSKAVSPSGGGSVTLGATSGYYNSVINISASAATGYSFSYWSKTGGTLGNAYSASTTITMPNANATVTANFTHNSYTLSKAVSPSGGGSVTLGATSGYYNSLIDISASASTGYSFSNWTTTGGTLGNANSASTTITMPNGNATVTANFTKINYTITKSAGTGGSITAQATGTYGEVVSITATPDPGYQFDGWTTTGGTLGNASAASTTLTMPAANVTITAAFSLIPKLVLWRCNQNGTKTITGTYGKYSFVLPADVTVYSLTYNGTTVSQPATAGDLLPNDKRQFELGSNYMVTLSFTRGSTNYTIENDIPKVISINKRL